MPHLENLKAADIFRDGGSYEAKFTERGGGRFVVYLEAHPDSPAQGGLRHTRLFAYSGEEMPSDARPIPKGSQEECELLRDLRAFLTVPCVEEPEPPHLERNYWIRRLSEMVAYIPNREDV